MDLQFRLPDAADDSELGQFHDWLLRERSLRTGAEISTIPAPPTADGMGLSMDAVELILNSGLQLASLAVAIVSYRKATEPRSGMTISRGDVEVRLSRGELEDVAAVLGALEHLRQAGDDESTHDDEDGEPGEGPGRQDRDEDREP
ncbi:effector-associated constant component EACC1 [Streptomyces marispadix]|uniref:Uncharacterized protein n=1 Tax=Streptomyces marispadix TaxID=2922868 RepID=A0ABS9STN5_9ACTN|nr:hypothetical protein [Streptomyces marispadix]MCH6159622.1 hypothetical protein [Streptomyces marispadix]